MGQTTEKIRIMVEARIGKHLGYSSRRPRLRGVSSSLKYMGRIEIEDFSDKNISRIFIAASMKEAEFVEDILTQGRID